MDQPKSKAELLAELTKLGVHPSGRKVRADKGEQHTYPAIRKIRSDIGTKRTDYNNDSPSVHKRHFQQLIQLNSGEDGKGDILMRDVNGIFPVEIDSYYKTVNVKHGTQYKSSTKRANHPELLRWRWWFKELEYAEPGSKEYNKWLEHICKWYFIQPRDVWAWSYQEWAWVYKKQIDSHNNRHVDNPVVLDYEVFLTGVHGYPEFDEEGDIIW